MKATSYRRLEAAVRVDEFMKAHPSDDPNHVALVARFKEEVAAAVGVAARVRSGRADAVAWTATKRGLKEAARRHVLPALTRIGEAIAAERPELAGRFRIPSATGRHLDFVAAVRSMIDTAREHAELMAQLGLGAGTVEEVERLIDEIDAAERSAEAARDQRVSSGAAVETALRALGRRIRALDGINRLRFRDNPALLASWNSARRIRDLPARGDASPQQGPVSSGPPVDEAA